MSEYHVELLAPAGSKEAFLGALHAGADAIYLAGTKYGARAYADNFTTEELLYCIRYAHIWGKKVYLTVNTLMKENELQDLGEYLIPFYEAGLDACIVQDLGAFQYIKAHFPEMELHVSTQMTITGKYGAAFLKELGATRIVPARELSLAEIRTMKEETGLEMETFIHGAMCYCYSGQCLFSSILGGRSGNRGRCAQPCRLPYQVDNGKGNSKECYPLSLKDMCTIEHIGALMNAGIDSFKIEGRMKKPEYAAGVTAIYRKYIDLKKKNPSKKLSFQRKDLEELSRLYIRSERQDGYYFKQNGADMITMESPAYSGSDDALLAQIRQKYIETKPKKKVSIIASVVSGYKIFVTFICEYLSVMLEGDVVEKAQNTPLSAESIEKQLKKLGDTCFEVESIEVETDNESFYSLKALNELRREAVTRLEDMLIESHGLVTKRKYGIRNDLTNSVNSDFATERSVCAKSTKSVSDNWTLVLSTMEQIKAFLMFSKKNNLFFGRIYIESELVLTEKIPQSLFEQNCYIALPYCMREKDESTMEKLLEFAKEYAVKGFLIRNIEEYAYLHDVQYTGEIYTDAGIYVWNSMSRNFWQDKVQGITCPYELNRKEYQSLLQDEVYEKLVYGHLPMMITANCVAKSTGNCKASGKVMQAKLTDRYKKQFPVAVDCVYCMNVVYNSVPVSLHKDLLKSNSNYTKKLMFTIEDEAKTLAILEFFVKIAEGIEIDAPYTEYTTAHEKRGVE